MNDEKPTDAALARLAVNRVLRFGLSEVLSEPTQQSLLQDLAEFYLPHQNVQLQNKRI